MDVLETRPRNKKRKESGFDLCITLLLVADYINYTVNILFPVMRLFIHWPNKTELTRGVVFVNYTCELVSERV